jgi:hypothetical protein
MKNRDAWVKVTCPLCGNVTLLAVVEEDFRAWEEGALIQNVMPYMDATERETLISGLCCECQGHMFKDPFDDDEDFIDEDWDGEPDDIDDDCGFDPYEGCFTFDC